VSEKPPPNGLKYVVQENDWVGAVAIRYGFADWENDVWMHTNNTQLRKKRKDPHVLAEGDELFIPPWEQKEESGATEQRHKFKLKTPSESLRLRVVDEDGEPVKHAKYTLNIECDGGGVIFKQQKTQTDGDGVVEEKIPSTAISGLLKVPDASIELQLDLGYLCPMDPTDEKLMCKGAQQRLKGLGYYAGSVDGQKTAALEAAIVAFQKFCHNNLGGGDPSITDPGDVDGDLSAKTRDALEKFYGC
jgi:putative peptidoglycan binding protein